MYTKTACTRCVYIASWCRSTFVAFRRKQSRRSAEFLLKRDRYSAPLVEVSVKTRQEHRSTSDRCAVKVSHKRDAGP
jgi:hypothetical protein